MDEAAIVADIHVASWRAGYRGLIPAAALRSLSHEEREATWRGLIEAGTAVHVGLQAGRAVGFVASGPSRDREADAATGEIYALYVRADAWGTGTGKQLHDCALDHLAAAGCARATLWVLADNVRARAFYERQGWRPDGETQSEDWRGVRLVEARYARPTVSA